MYKLNTTMANCYCECFALNQSLAIVRDVSTACSPQPNAVSGTSGYYSANIFYPIERSHTTFPIFLAFFLALFLPTPASLTLTPEFHLLLQVVNLRWQNSTVYTGSKLCPFSRPPNDFTTGPSAKGVRQGVRLVVSRSNHVRVPRRIHALLRRRSGHHVPQDSQLA